MTFAIRRCTEADVPAMVALKEVLRAGTGRGGFLLGTDRAGYLARVGAGGAWALCREERLVGFAIGLPDAVFRHSDVWARRDQVDWQPGFDPATLEAGRLGYFDQLAVSPTAPGARRWAGPLAGRAVRHLFADADHLVATTVVEPLCNRAAVPFLERFGGRRVGRIAETHDAIGALVSDVWTLARADFEARCEAPVGLAEAWAVRQLRAAS